MEQNKLKALAGDMLHFDFSDVTLTDAPCVTVKHNGTEKSAGGATVPQKLRALSLYALHAAEENFSLCQEPRFEQLGAMLDFSRGGVMRVEKVKEYILHLALYGANEILLYTEDTYELPDRPHFGYLRGAYTAAELREIDDYADELGVEVVPCIQTLGHMAQYLSWGEETNAIRDTDSVLLCDSDETYRFIEEEIAQMRAVFRSKQIHIGMDEANNVGLGTYLAKHGYTDRFDLLKRHLGRVTALCRKYEFKPMMWSDMFFDLGSTAKNYYDTNAEFPENASENIPDVSLVYWDYYHNNAVHYQKMIANHRKLERPIVFAGGIWTWHGFLPNTQKSFTTMLPALRVCADEKISNVIATMWGDDGCETDYFRGLYGFAIFSENCYAGSGVSEAEIRRMGAMISGMSTELVLAMDAFHCNGDFCIGKRLVWGDIFYNQLGADTAENDWYRLLSEAAASDGAKEDAFTRLLLETAALKAKVYAEFQRDYKAKNDLTVYAQDILPHIAANLRELYRLHEENWMALNKVFGFERIEARYAASIHRAEYAAGRVKAYIAKEIPAIEELEYEPRFKGRRSSCYQCTAFGKTSAF